MVIIFDEFFKQRRRYFQKRMKIFDFRRTKKSSEFPVSGKFSISENPENFKNFLGKPKKDTAIDLKESLKQLKSELDEHLEAINQNTGEIQDSYGCINEINNKMEKFAERLERIELFLQTNSNFIVEEGSFDVKPLTSTEQQVFLVIYALEDEKGLVSYAEIRRKTGLSVYMVSEYIIRLAEKGIPLIRKYVNNLPYIKLNPDFKRLQAKENILMIDTSQKELLNF